MPKLIYESWAGTRHLIEVTAAQAEHLLKSGFHREARPEDLDKDGTLKQDAAPVAAAVPAPPPFPEPAPATKAERAAES